MTDSVYGQTQLLICPALVHVRSVAAVLLGVSDCGETDNDMSWIISEQCEELAEGKVKRGGFLVMPVPFSKHLQSLTRCFGSVSSVAERVQS